MFFFGGGGLTYKAAGFAWVCLHSFAHCLPRLNP